MIKQNSDQGFSLAEVMIVAGMLSMLGIIMLSTVISTKDVSMAIQSSSEIQAKLRAVSNMMERDVRSAGSGLYESFFLGQVDDDLDSFNYDFSQNDLDGMMLPPVEVTNGTDTEIVSYLNPLATMMGLTSQYREPGTDVITMYYQPDTLFSGTIDKYQGVGQENFGEIDLINGEKLYQLWDRMGQRPITLFVIDNDGQYATMRTVTRVSKQATEYSIKMEPSNAFNQPSNMKGFLEDIYGKSYFTTKDPVTGDFPPSVTEMVKDDLFAQLRVVTYFIYSHPDPAENARGWLVRIELGALTSLGAVIDATDPDTVRPYVVAENVSDLQVALGIDLNTNDILEDNEWINDEDMEDYNHFAGGLGSASNDFLNLMNNLRTIRFTLVSHTDVSTVEEKYGFIDPNSGAFSSSFPNVGSVASKIGIAPTLEDRIWTTSALTDRLWYRRAVQQGRMVKVRNMDLAGTFAR